MQADTVIHTSCEHVLPVLRAARNIPAPRHIVAVTPEQAGSFALLRDLAGPAGLHVEKINVQAEQPAEFVRRVLKLLSGLPAGNHTLHLHGAPASVLLDLQAHTAANGLSAFFIDPDENQVRWQLEPARRETAVNPGWKVADFFAMAGYRLDTGTCAQALDGIMARETAALAAWREKDKTAGFAESLRDLVRKPGKPFKVGPDSIGGTSFAAALKPAKDGSKGTLEIDQRKYTLRPWADLAAFVCGSWHRDLLISSMVPLLKQAGMTDVQAAPDAFSEHPPAGMPQRFRADLAFTDGARLYLVQTRRKEPEPYQVRDLAQAASTFACDAARALFLVDYTDRALPASTPLLPGLHIHRLDGPVQEIGKLL